mgnify:CR=1 FL=1
MRERPRRGVAGRDHAPEAARRGEVERGPQAGQEHVGGELHEEVADEEDAGGEVEVGARHAQVGFQGALPRLGEVGPVEEVEEVHEDERRHQARVHLAQEAGLGGAVLGRVARGEEGRPCWGCRVRRCRRGRMVSLFVDGFVGLVDVLFLVQARFRGVHCEEDSRRHRDGSR